MVQIAVHLGIQLPLEKCKTSYQLPQLGYETQYFWKVVPTNAGGDASGCSVISFTTQKNPAGSLFITGSSITVSKNAYLYLEKDFTNTGGSVTLNSDSNEFASIVVEGSASGDITYNKYVNYVGSDEWDLVGSPVTTQSVSDFVTANDDPLAIDPTGPTYYAIGTHDAATNSYHQLHRRYCWRCWKFYTCKRVPDGHRLWCHFGLYR